MFRLRAPAGRALLQARALRNYSTASTAPIAAGDTVPEATLFSMVDGKPAKLSTAEIFAGKTVVLFAVPGAFTPG